MQKEKSLLLCCCSLQDEEEEEEEELTQVSNAPFTTTIVSLTPVMQATPEVCCFEYSDIIMNIQQSIALFTLLLCYYIMFPNHCTEGPGFKSH
jgi:hypothetical protein